MIEIVVKNTNSTMYATEETTLKIRGLMAIKAKNYFWSPAYRQRKWDGFINYMTPKGLFETGLLSEVCNNLRKINKKFIITDEREKFKDLHLVDELGDLILREDQKVALHTLLNHKIEGLKFVRGIMAEATNYGKSIISAGVFAAFSQKRRGLLLVNSKTLFDQALPDLQNLLGKEQVGWVSSQKGVNWKRVNVCMVQTLGSRIKSNIQIRNELSKQDIVLIDEYDEVIGRKDCKLILKHCYNAPIRIGFTGSELMSKDKNRNMEQIKFCGPVIHKTTNKELVEQGISTKPNIKFVMGNDRIKIKGNWNEEYKKGIIKNKRRNRKVWRITNRVIEKGPVLILFKIHKHGYELLAKCPQEFMNFYNVALVHHKTSNREELIEKFNNGKIDVLISSMILKRGKNIPMIRTLINAAGGDSEANILQLFGRALRKHKSKNVVDIIDFFDIGAYLQRHSKHRIRYYKKQGFEVKELYKTKLKELNY